MFGRPFHRKLLPGKVGVEGGRHSAPARCEHDGMYFIASFIHLTIWIDFGEGGGW